MGPCLACIDKAERERGSTTRLTVIIPPSWNVLARERFEERAAIKEYCGNLSREDAEREALEEIRAELDRERTASQLFS